ncbi:MAG: hypothetical protein COU29_00580 [Candidatus Magasanikbacteria bacterium CG10_big_fil_rev_8_21_14_0_10_36_32]|uniref:Phosphoribosyltransferase domain-containing protein n=1 Tax=Candidatus Magasanikbacteria bacterium CG10_big_fil_rev_8_21_14_0_10_36_32 TaxID=1974646 RepID=A0A2M6W7I7_9BACT|nr:MAG: hypothetical protein COU29_00580 [Candidatus Magasanikbacteria bacterium CG10_big_fil_rev_8_21_14_0_10_36_32]
MDNFFKFIKDILFPIFCVDCGKEGEWWCSPCRKKIKSVLIAKCPVCHRHSEFGAVCVVCRSVSSLDGLVSYLPYFEKYPAAILIHKFKYQYAKDIVEIWKKIMSPINFFWLENKKTVAIIPVPLHSRRERERGFNQADLLVGVFHDKMSAEFSTVDFQINRDLIRRRFTQQQAKLTKEERLENIKDAFDWQGKECPKTIILIDDVFTSGATMQECAKILKSAGAEIVWGVTLSRAE